MIAYLFDVDGVLNNIQTRKIVRPEIIQILISLLQKGDPLGFISGRGLLWLRSNVVKVLENYLNDHPGFEKNILDNMFVSGEFGGVVCTHQNGIRKESVNRELSIPEDVQRGLHLVSFQYSEFVFIDTEKQTIFTVEGNHGIKEEEFQSRKNTIVEEFQQVIASYPELEVQADRLAINIRYKKANKNYATDMFLSWLKNKSMSPEKYIVFGDSLSDLEMGEEIHKQNLPFEFVFVGEQSELNQTSTGFPLTITKGHCDEGTIEYFKTHQS